MAIPNQTITIQDPGLGLTEPNTNVALIMGASSTGTDNTVVSFSRIGDVEPVLGEGPLVEYVTRQLQVAGGPVLAMKIAASTPGDPGTIVQSGAGPLATIAGASFDTYQGVITIVLGGILGTATFTYTLDNGTTTSGVLTVPAGGTFVIPATSPAPGTNLTVTFPAGTYLAAETYTWTAEEPRHSGTDVTDGFDALQLINLEYDYVTLSTVFLTAAAAATIFTAVAAELGELFNVFEYKAAIMDASVSDTATTISAFDAIASDSRISPCYGLIQAPSGKPFVGRGTRFSSVALAQSIEAGRQLISTDLARVANGSLPGVSFISHNEANTEVMDQNKFTTTRTWKGRSGFFLTNARMRSEAGSDFLYWQHRRIIDETSEVVQVQQQNFISIGVRTTGSGNVIDERDATRLEALVTKALRVVLSNPANAEGTQGHVTAFKYQIDRTNDVLTSQTIIGETRVKPFGYVKFIITTIGFTNELSTDVEETAA